MSLRAIASSAASASRRASFSHTSRYAWNSPSFLAMESRYAFVSSSAEYSFESSARRASAIVSVSRFMLLFPGNHLFDRDAIPRAGGSGREQCLRVLAAFVRSFIRAQHVAQPPCFGNGRYISFLDGFHEREDSGDLAL